MINLFTKVSFKKKVRSGIRGLQGSQFPIGDAETRGNKNEEKMNRSFPPRDPVNAFFGLQVHPKAGYDLNAAKVEVREGFSRYLRLRSFFFCKIADKNSVLSNFFCRLFIFSQEHLKYVNFFDVIGKLITLSVGNLCKES